MVDEPVPGTGPSTAERKREVAREWPAWLILALLWGASFLAFPRLPGRVPVHWNLQGQVDRWGSPWEATVLVPALATGLYLFILAIDWGGLDFRAARAMSVATVRQVRILILLFIGALHAVILGATLKGGTLREAMLWACIDGFLILLGNLMPRLEPNAWVGIRIPPTLESRDIWKRTHRLAGRVFVIGGLVLLPACLLPEPFAMIVSFVGIAALFLVPTVYAYRLRAARPC